MNLEEKRRFAKLLKEARLNLGLTQVQMAKALDVSQYSVGSWEDARATPTPDNLHKVARILLNITYDQLWSLVQGEEQTEPTLIIVKSAEEAFLLVSQLKLSEQAKLVALLGENISNKIQD